MTPIRRGPAILRLALCLSLLPACFSTSKEIDCPRGDFTCPQGLFCPRDNRRACLPADCGDGLIGLGEECDDAVDGQPRDTERCNLDCTIARHGDGKVNKSFGEECDGDNEGHGNGRNCESSICNADCTFAKHGDGKVNAQFEHELCDGDNNSHGNGVDCSSPTCNADCTPSACGDSKTNPAAGEECDTGGQTETCTARCKTSKCGDSYKNPAAHEECDEGPANADNASCTASCHWNVCGDGHRATSGSYREDCDDGADNKDESDCTLGCRVAFCGDGHVHTLGPNGHEECDIALKDLSPKGLPDVPAGNHCNLGCKWNYCGDGVPNRADEEMCDLGAQGNADTGDCPHCKLPTCGDGYVWANHEDCDRGPGGNGPDGDCPRCRNAFCGDGLIDTKGALQEECDTGLSATATTADAQKYDGVLKGSHCVAGCKWNRHGDGIVSPSDGEWCDEPTKGGTACQSPACNDDCTVSFCGDKKKNGLAGEECDNGDWGRSCYDYGQCNSQNGDCLPSGTRCNDNTGDCSCKRNVCGDEYRNFNGKRREACDSRIAFDCGSCVLPRDTNECQFPVMTPPPRASGVIHLLSNTPHGGFNVSFIDANGSRRSVRFYFGTEPASSNAGGTLILYSTDDAPETVALKAQAVIADAIPVTATTLGSDIRLSARYSGSTAKFHPEGLRALGGIVATHFLDSVDLQNGTVETTGNGYGCQASEACEGSGDCLSGQCRDDTGSGSKVCR